MAKNPQWDDDLATLLAFLVWFIIFATTVVIAFRCLKGYWE